MVDNPFAFTVPLSVAELDVTSVAELVATVGGKDGESSITLTLPVSKLDRLSENAASRVSSFSHKK